MDKYRVTLTAEERADLEHLVSVGKAAARKLTHARILLLADDSLSNERPDDQIVAALGTSPRTASLVPTRSRSRGMSSSASSNWPAAIPPRDVATGPWNSWPTNWSSWASSRRS